MKDILKTANSLDDNDDDENVQKTQLKYQDLFHKIYLKPTCLLLIMWITGTVSNYTLIFNVTKLHGNLFVNNILSQIASDVPGTALLSITMKYFSRRFTLFYNYVVLGACCIILAFMPKTVSI